MNTLASATTLAALLMLAYNDPSTTSPITAPAAAMAAYAITEVQGMNYAASVIQAKEAVPIHSCVDGLSLIQSLPILDIKAFEDPAVIQVPHKLYCLVQVGETQANFTLNTL